LAARTARARAGDDGGDDRSSARINGRSERRGDRRAVGSAPSSSSSSPFSFFLFFLLPFSFFLFLLPFFSSSSFLLPSSTYLLYCWPAAGGARRPDHGQPASSGTASEVGPRGRRGRRGWGAGARQERRPSAAGVVGAGPRPRGRRIRAGAPAGRRGERRRAWARLARVLGRRCRRRVVAGTGRQSSEARARLTGEARARLTGEARARRGVGAAEREGGGGGCGQQARGRSAGGWDGPAFLVMRLCRVPGDDGTRQRIFLIFFKFLYRVPHDLAPGKGFFAGCPGWHPVNYYYFFVFLPHFFVGTCYSKYIPISKFGTIMSFLTIFP